MVAFKPDLSVFENEGEVISVKTRKINSSNFNEKEQEPVIENFEIIPEIKNYDSPIFKVPVLPSGFFTYPENTFFNIEDYAWGEVNYINESDLNTLDEWDFILSGIHSNIDKELLTIQDFYYLEMRRRLETIGSQKFIVNIDCKNIHPDKKYYTKDKFLEYIDTIKDKFSDKDFSFDNYKNEIMENISKKNLCNKTNNFVINEKQIAFDDLQINKFPYIIRINEKDYEFSPLTIKDAKFLIKNKLLNDKKAQIAIQCRNEDFNTFYDLISSKKVRYLEGLHLSELESKFQHGILPITKDLNGEKYKCSDCGQELTIRLDGGKLILLPFRENEQNIMA